MNRTSAQERAISSNSPEICVIAGPGSGKTQTSVERIRRLIADGVDPRKIVCLTFTNAAARETERRLGTVKASPNGDESVPYVDAPIKLGFCGTLHGFALRCLKQYGEGMGYGGRLAIIDQQASSDLLASKAQSLGCKMKLADLMKLKAQGRPPIYERNSQDRRRLSISETVVLGYYDDLRSAGIVDFDVMLEEFWKLLGFYKGSNGHERTEALPMAAHFTHLFVDEVQDSGETDWLIYDRLPMAHKFFVGDPDQAIYSFRGGRVDCLMRFAQGGDAEVIRLDENFRSQAKICAAANALIYCNENRIPKDTVSAKGPGGQVHILPQSLNEGAEISDVVEVIGSCGRDGWTEIAVLARTNAIASAFAKAIDAAGFNVQQRKKTELPKDWSLALSLVELLVNPENDTLAFFYLIQKQVAAGVATIVARAVAHEVRQTAARHGNSINRQKFAFTEAKLEDLGLRLAAEHISDETRMMVAQLMRELPEDADLLQLALAMAQRHKSDQDEGDRDGIMVTTIHGAKGLEFDVVFLVGFEDEVIPGQRKTDTWANIEEERRLAFVGVTRARSRVYISCCDQRTTAWGAIVHHTPSRFIKELLP